MRVSTNGIEEWTKMGAGLVVPTWLALQAEAYISSGRVKEAHDCLDRAFVASRRNRDEYYDTELYRLKGDALAAESKSAKSGQADEAAACYFRAVRVARRQKVKALKLRAAMSFCRLWLKEEKKRRTRNALTKIYGRFTEGFDTPDLQAARALLSELF